MAKTTSLTDLSHAWLNAKTAEDDARNHRIALEEEIEALIPGPAEGSASTTEGGLKITVTRKYTRTLDIEAYAEVCDQIPDALSPVTIKPVLDLKQYRALERGNPAIFKIVQKFVEIKPAKTAVKVEAL